MAIKTHKVTLSLDNPRVIQSGINVQSFDKQSIQISIELTKNDEVFQVPSDATIRVSLLKLARQEQKIIVDVPNTNRDSIDWIVPDYLDGYQGVVRVGVYLVSGAENVDLGYFTILSNVSDIDKMADEFTDNVFQGWEQIEADLNELNLTIAQAESDLNGILTTADSAITNINAKNTQVNTLASDFTTDVATKQSDVTNKYNAFNTSVTQANQTIDDILALQPQFQSVLDETTGKDVISGPEVILARNGKSNLKTRLDEDHAQVTAQLAEKVGQGVKADLEDLSADVLGALSGNATFNLLSEPQNNSVNYDKMAVELQKDMFALADNIISNGDFSNGITSWTNYGSATYVVENGQLKITPTSRYGGARQRNNVLKSSLILNHKYYVSAKVKSDSTNFRVYLYDDANKLYDVGTHSGSGQFETISNVLTYDVALTNYSFLFSDWQSGGWTPTFIDEIIVIDLTETFGIGKEPSTDRLNKMLDVSGWFDARKNLYTPDVTYELINELDDTIKSIAITESELKDKTIVNFGDSIIGNAKPPTDISSHLALLTNANVLNQGYGGTSMTKHPLTAYNPFSMCNLVDAIISRDFSTQESQLANVPEYFTERLNNLKGISFDNVDYVTLSFGTNDWGNTYPGDNQSNEFDKKYFISATRYVCSEIWANYPNVKILITTPTYRYGLGVNEDEDSDTHLRGSYSLLEWVESAKVIGKELKVPVLDNYNEANINKYNRDYYFDVGDETHPNETGRKLLAGRFAGALFNEF